MMRFLWLLAVLFLFAACSSNGPAYNGKPKNFIKPDKMKVVFFDVLRAQEYAKTKYGRDTVAVNTNMAVMLLQVFRIYGVSKDQFYDSFHYYEAHPEMDDELFDSLAAYANQKRQDLYKKMK